MNKARVFANLSVRVPPEVLEQLHNLKVSTGKSLNQLVVEALEEYILRRSGAKEETAREKQIRN